MAANFEFTSAAAQSKLRKVNKKHIDDLIIQEAESGLLPSRLSHTGNLP